MYVGTFEVWNGISVYKSTPYTWFVTVTMENLRIRSNVQCNIWIGFSRFSFPLWKNLLAIHVSITVKIAEVRGFSGFLIECLTVYNVKPYTGIQSQILRIEFMQSPRCFSQKTISNWSTQGKPIGHPSGEFLTVCLNSWLIFAFMLTLIEDVQM